MCIAYHKDPDITDMQYNRYVCIDISLFFNYENYKKYSITKKS